MNYINQSLKNLKSLARFKDNISTADLPEMELLSSKNQKIKYYYVW